MLTRALRAGQVGRSGFPMFHIVRFIVDCLGARAGCHAALKTESDLT